MLILDTVNRLTRRAVSLGGGRAVQRSVGGHQLHWYEFEGSGKGPPAVFVHGLGGSANTFFPLFSALRKSHSRLYAPDLPGHGFSPVAGSGPLDIREHYEVVKQFLTEVVREPPVLIGNSMGGAISLQAAIDRPETAGLGLLAPAGAPLGPEGMAQLERHFHMKGRGDAMRLMRQMMHRVPAGSWLVAHEMLEAFANPVVHHVLAKTNPEETMDTAAIRALTMPITLVWGASERLLPSRGIDFFRAHLPSHARIEVFEKCGHVPMLEQPRRTVRVLEELASAATRHVNGRSGNAAAGR